MNLKGFKNYLFDTFSLITIGEIPEYRFTAYNEFLYLVSKELVSGTTIRSDTRILTVDQFFIKRNFQHIHEFTGLINIYNPRGANQLIEFIRVIPQ